MFAVVFFALYSCRKTRTCECIKITNKTIIANGNSNIITTSTTSSITKDSQKKAEFRKSVTCYGYKTSYINTFESTTEVIAVDATCEIK